ncbi:Co2+/Mg2+ efflux protein ApaG [Thiopseudomonas acetoxidans]|uniref:Protein ApaG n=1 Tax=Thiopseudomonas acetoxidans TaxID=3041622 RepID=A0ABT7SKT4_9GAMM|nr:Co2+/Mg2+ efflux protein ApaG [Thiopseudomonas sp. CY1220]MDM7856795.1 Co2+/Mg2+ efflux protein ApaG [Thiopseudomonas sp. CY1220]
MSIVPPKVDVSVTTRFLAEQSQPEENRFVFAYDIVVHNQSDIPVQLLTRHWIITDGQGKTQEVRGDGVVGEQPTIEPQTEYRYSSGTLLNTEVGSMYGSFGMQTLDGQKFEAPIAAFTLARPGVLH